MANTPTRTALAALALIIAGCGSGGSSTTRSGAHSSRRPTTTIYRTRLSPAGAPKGSGEAVIALHGASRLCWRFAHLHGFSGATGASLGQGAPAGATRPVARLTTGVRLRHRGCIRIRASLSDGIRHNPSDYYVNVSSRQFPAGAVRGRLG